MGLEGINVEQTDVSDSFFFFFFCLVEVVEKPVFAWGKNMRERQSADLPDKEETDVSEFF